MGSPFAGNLQTITALAGFGLREGLTCKSCLRNIFIERNQNTIDNTPVSRQGIEEKNRLRPLPGGNIKPMEFLW